MQIGLRGTVVEQHLALVDVEQIGVALACAIEPASSIERVDVLAVAIDDFEPRRDRFVGLAELLLVQLGDAREQLCRFLIARRNIDAAAQDIDELAPVRAPS